MKSKFTLLATFALLIGVNYSAFSQWNLTGNVIGAGNYLGTNNNQPLNFRTDNIQRMKLMQNGNSTINGFPGIAQGGFVGLSSVPGFFSGVGPFSMLHLNGATNLGAIQLGFRPWMKTGITFTENTDMMYVGRKSVSEDATDAVISWSDDEAGPPYSGPDNMLFLFTKGDAADISNPDGDITGTGMNGREIMRLTGSGNIGVGPRFDNDYQPKSTIHQHQENSSDSWYQITNQAMTIAGNQTEPTAINATNGLRVGIKGHENQQMNGNALIYNQEKRHLLFSTAHNTDATDIGNGNTLERMRISSISAPTNLATGGYGVYNPAGLPSNLTRVAISRDPNNPVTRPMSLFHLGHNIGTAGAPTSTHGWRRWMDIGMFTSNETENLYVGLKAEGGNTYDAVINWGDDQDEESPDNLRFIFTSTPGGSGDAESQSFHGKEVGRFAPTGEFGVGNFYTNGLNEQPTEMLDVDGTARFRQMPHEMPNVLITGVDQDEDPVDGDYVLNYLAFPEDETMFLNGLGEWSEIESTGSGCDWNIVNGGADVATGYGAACVNRAVGIGTPNPNTKLQVDFDGALPEGFEDVAIDAIARSTNGGQTMDRIAVRGTSLNEDEEFIANLYGGFFTAYGGGKTYGMFAESFRTPNFNSSDNIGAVGKSVGISSYGDNMGVQGFASNAFLNCGVMGEAGYYDVLGGPQPMWAIGVQGVACGANRNIGVYGKIPSTMVCSTGTRYAGLFDGDIYTTGSYLPSDESLKLNIEDFASGLEIINQLNPKTYTYDTESFGGMNLPTGDQFGLIAGELQEVLPNLTKTVVSPGEKDEDGNEIFPEVEFTGVNYTGLIPILISAVKEQQQTITALEELVNSQNETLAQVMGQMEQLQQQIESCCNYNGSDFKNFDGDEGKSLQGENILHQNNPNPFRSQTTISYDLEQGGKVVLNVYDKTGKPIATLVDEEQQSGHYKYNWNASGLPAGVYNYALYVDGELLVKKAIKLAD